jgi:hypothetical protein
MSAAMRRFVRVVVYCCGAVSAVAADQDRVSFNRDIRPIMSDTCFRCHGPDRNVRMAGMRLDLREEAIRPTRSGQTPIVPGDADTSEIIARIFASGPRAMPPAAAHKALTPQQKTTIRRWVEEGAVYEGHWAISRSCVRRCRPPRIRRARRTRSITSFRTVSAVRA